MPPTRDAVSTQQRRRRKRRKRRKQCENVTAKQKRLFGFGFVAVRRRCSGGAVVTGRQHTAHIQTQRTYATTVCHLDSVRTTRRERPQRKRETDQLVCSSARHASCTGRNATSIARS